MLRVWPQIFKKWEHNLPRHSIPKLGRECHAVFLQSLKQVLESLPPDFNIVALHGDFLEPEQNSKPKLDQEIFARLYRPASRSICIVDDNGLALVPEFKHSRYSRFDHIKSRQADLLELAVLGELAQARDKVR